MSRSWVHDEVRRQREVAAEVFAERYKSGKHPHESHYIEGHERIAAVLEERNEHELRTRGP